MRLKTNNVLLIHPPVVRPCEPPPGIARLCGALKRRSIDYDIIDANLEGLMFLSQRPLVVRDTWTRRAVSRVERNLEALMQPTAYQN
ncbi:MAG: radical SAM protein, partial [Desulfobacteraceae bacterium]|nr:radical SAM protein [Desulfobacteraceae bacterium]